jgi:hypothetical protein
LDLSNIPRAPISLFHIPTVRLKLKNPGFLPTYPIFFSMHAVQHRGFCHIRFEYYRPDVASLARSLLATDCATPLTYGAAQII